MFSQYHQRNSEPNESMVGYNFDTNSWNVLDMGGNFHTEAMPEGGESQGFFDFNPNNNTIFYHCCTSGSNQPEDINHDWWYDVVGQSGRDKHTSPKPPAPVLLPGGAFDPAHNVFVFHGGSSFVGTWAYDPVGNAWRQMFPGGTVPDPSLALPGVAYSTKAQKLYLFGGQSETTGLFNSDLYIYDYPSNTWTLITPANGVRPPGRTAHAFAYDSTNNIFLLYGGRNSSVLNDTWVYNPTTNVWTQVTTPGPTASSVAVYAKMSYDSDHNVFVMAQIGDGGGYYGGYWNTYGIQTWLFRYAGAGPNAGTLQSTTAPPSGSLNRYNTGWAKDPALVSAGGSLYVAWSESGSPFSQIDDAWPHMYVSQYSGGNWSPLGTSYLSISNDIFEAHAPSLAIVNGNPWISYYQSSNTGQTAKVYTSSWDGVSTWTGSTVGLTAGGSLFQGQSQITAVGSVPHVALLEVDKTVYPQRTLALVSAWNGSAWAFKGSALNQNTVPGSTAMAVSIASNGSNPVAAWSEYLHTPNGNGYDYDTNPQVYVAAWNGSQWVALGSSLNVNPANWASDPSITYLAGTFYVAWVERTQAGNNQLYVKAWNGTAWQLVGAGALNQASGAGWAYHPSLVSDPAHNSLYLGWVEQVALGQKARVFVSRYAGSSWTNLGGALNADPIQGSAQRVSIGVFNGQPVAAWGEVNMGATRQVFVKQWSGTSWIQLPGPAVPDITPPLTPAGLRVTSVSATQVSLLWDPPTNISSTDTVGVIEYFVSRNGSRIATVTSTLAYQDTGQTPGTTNCYTVAAVDAAGNVSAQSAPACAATVGGAAINSIVLSPSAVVGGTVTTSNTVTLSSAAPAGGAIVTLSSNSASAAAPASVTIAGGASVSPVFSLTTTAVAVSTPVKISAVYGGTTASATLTVLPPSPSSVTLSPASVLGGVPTSSNIVKLNGPAPAGGVIVTLASNNAAATVPLSVAIAAGAVASPAFTITTGLVSAATPVAVSATCNGVTVAATLTVMPLAVSTVTLSSVPQGGQAMTGTVRLNGPAPIGGAVVKLASNNPAATVPASVTVAAGATVSPAFTITTTAVTTPTTVIISAIYGGATATATLSLASTSAGSPPTLKLRGNSSEVNGVQNGAVVTPTITPAGFNGTLKVNPGGSVNFAAAGDGVYFLNCCANTGNAYYQFKGTNVGAIFGASQGQITFNLTSRYSFAQRQAQAAGQRYAFDVVDGSGKHQFDFMTQITAPYLTFMYTAGGSEKIYFVPPGQEDALFGSGVQMQVVITWNGAGSQLYLNGNLVASAPAAGTAATWNATSTFDLGAFEYQTFGGYNSCDDQISEFTVTTAGQPLPPTVSLTSPVNGATLSGTVVVAAAASAPLGVSSVQFRMDGNNVGSVSTPPYSINWNTASSANGSHTLSAVVTDMAGVTATSGTVSVIVNNVLPTPAASALTLSPGSVLGGNPTTQNTVTLTGPAPAGGAVVKLTSNNPAATVPASVTVAAGATVSPAFTITTTAVATATPVLISAVYGGATATATLSLASTTSGSPPALQLRGNSSELSGVQNGAVVTPAVTPAGFNGTLKVNPGGSVNFAAAGDGVYFLNCCANTGNAYYQFKGTNVGAIFGAGQGQITFNLTSRYSFAQRQAQATGQRYVFDVVDGSGKHQFDFMTQITAPYLTFMYTAGGSEKIYFVPPGKEDALFGAGVQMQVMITWSGSGSQLYLNGNLVASIPTAGTAATWNASSTFDLGAFEYQTFGGYNSCDDQISEFTVTDIGGSG